MTRSISPKKNGQKPWERNVGSFLIFYSILAALGGVFFYLVAYDKDFFTDVKLLALIPIALSIFLFVTSIEKITDSLDELDVEKYVTTFIPFNIGVFLLIYGLVFTTYFIFYSTYKLQTSLSGLIIGGFGYRFDPPKTGLLLDILGLSIFLGKKYVHDTWWLITKPENEYKSYIAELDGLRKPEYDRKLAFKIFKKIRQFIEKRRNRKVETETPIFKDSHMELRPSKIDGVGVFALKQISEGDFIAEGIRTKDYDSLVPWKYFDGLNEEIRKKVDKFCIGAPEGFFPPDDYDFSKLSTEWYMNHSCNGNVGFDDNGDFIAIKEICPGEEMTYDYALAESNPKFLMKCKCGSENCRKTITGNDWKAFRKNNVNHMFPYLINIA